MMSSERLFENADPPYVEHLSPPKTLGKEPAVPAIKDRPEGAVITF